MHAGHDGMVETRMIYSMECSQISTSLGGIKHTGQFCLLDCWGNMRDGAWGSWLVEVIRLWGTSECDWVTGECDYEM